MSALRQLSIRPPRWMRRIYPEAVWTLPSAHDTGPTAYLTFDDGPVEGITDRLLDTLATEQIMATFFCIGQRVEENPGIYQRILSEGHAVGNHSFSHISGLKMSTTDYLKDVGRCAELVDSRLFRPPYGRMRPAQYRRLKEVRKIVMYDVLSGDFYPESSPDDCLQNVMDNVSNGSIVVMHDNEKVGWKTVEYLPEVIGELKSNGFHLRRIE